MALIFQRLRRVWFIKNTNNMNYILTLGSACIHIAARFGYLPVLAYLVAKGENVDLVGSNGMTALMWASYMAYGYAVVLSSHSLKHFIEQFCLSSTFTQLHVFRCIFLWKSKPSLIIIETKQFVGNIKIVA